MTTIHPNSQSELNTVKICAAGIYRLRIFCPNFYFLTKCSRSPLISSHLASPDAPPPSCCSWDAGWFDPTEAVSASSSDRDSSTVRSSGPSRLRREAQPRGWTGCSGPPPQQRHWAEPPGGTEVFQDRWNPESLWLLCSGTS